MTLFFADLVREASHGTGSGDLPLSGALPGHRSFAEAVPAGARFHYAIAGVTRPDQWETGEGEIGASGMLVRMPLSSSAGGAAVDFAAGLKTVALTVGAQWFAGRESESEELAGKANLAGAEFSGPVSAPTVSLSQPLALASGGTGAASAAGARAQLGLGSMAMQNGGAVAITGGSISGLAELSVTGLISTTDDTSSQLRLGRYAPGAPAYVQPTSGAAGLAFQSPNGAVAFYLTDTDRSIYATSGSPVARFTDGGVNVAGAVSVAGTQVLSARRGGWGAPTGTAARGAFDTASVGTAELAERVKALIDDLAAHGLIGA